MAASLIDNFISILTALIMHEVNDIHNSHLAREKTPFLIFCLAFCIQFWWLTKV